MVKSYIIPHGGWQALPLFGCTQIHRLPSREERPGIFKMGGAVDAPFRASQQMPLR
jgi:hypothetical protein